MAEKTFLETFEAIVWGKNYRGHIEKNKATLNYVLAGDPQFDPNLLMIHDINNAGTHYPKLFDEQ